MLELCVRTLILADISADSIACCRIEGNKVSWRLVDVKYKVTLHSGVTTVDEWRKTILQELDKILLEVNCDKRTT
jgi:hypothetical protein